jgi:predicted PurR-regulated permease PerM
MRPSAVILAGSRSVESRARSEGAIPNEEPEARRPELAPRPVRSPRSERPQHHVSRRSLQVAFAVTAALVGVLVLYLIRDVIGAFVLGALLAFLMTPAVERLRALGIPRAVAIVLLFGLLTLILAGLVAAMAPLLTTELVGLQRQAPSMATEAQARLSALQGQPLNVAGFRVDLTRITDAIATHANDFLLGQFGNALSFGITALTTAFQVVLMLIIAFLLALDSHALSRTFRNLVPVDYRSDFDQVWSDIKGMLYAYMRGQLIIAALIGIASGLAVQLLGLPYALALGLLAGITSLVPYLGPFLGAIPAVLIGLAAGPQQALLVALAYLVISNVILNFVFPKVMGDAVRLPPILVITAFIAGFSLAGILGMFIAIPVAATLRILYDHIHPRLYGPSLASPR